ncbi:MAG: hypothetical protein GY774_16435 [Planctomycetes bacterium]|nr:hypothetical protein [Planctomycetota bacterium]
MTTVEFEFKLEQKVKTKFGDEGFVEQLSFDDSGKKYYVQRGDYKGRFFRADELTVVQ